MTCVHNDCKVIFYAMSSTSTHVLPPTEERVPLHTSMADNVKITLGAIARVKNHFNSPPSVISKSIEELENEWDIERVLEFNSSSLTIIIFALAWYWHSWKPLLVAFAIAVFLLQHALHGWCPPMPVLRAMVK